MFGGYCVLILMFFMIGGEVVYLLKWVIVVFVFGGYLVEQVVVVMLKGQIWVGEYVGFGQVSGVEQIVGDLDQLCM